MDFSKKLAKQLELTIVLTNWLTKFYIKNKLDSTVSGTIISDISDHFTNFIGIPNIVEKLRN